MRAWLLLVVSLYSLSLVHAVCFLLPNDQNVALRRPACQSSQYTDGGPKRAVDGNIDSDYGKGSCTHTSPDFPAWWRVDLADRYKISMVQVVNRADCCRERLAGAEVWIGDSDDYQKNVLCGTILDITSPSVQICCNRMLGRYVSIVIPGRIEQLTLCEVEVFGVPEKDRTVCE